ncbi:hypothetical protein GCM10027447_02010 [Glycomyces halotolerans]
MNKRTIVLGAGHFGWPKPERQTDTWARLILTDPAMAAGVLDDPYVRLNQAAEGRYGRLIARVEHLTHRPTTGAPRPGSDHVLGTGQVRIAGLPEERVDGRVTVALTGVRFDPDRLYRLHTHWVSLRLEPAR